MATGGGWFIPEPGTAVGIVTGTGVKATFGFVARNKNAVVSGNLDFQYHDPDAGLSLKSASYDWANLGTVQALFEGEGTLNGSPGHKFRVRAVDGDKLGGGVADRFEIRIWTAGGDFNSPQYRADGDLGGGNIVVHKNK